MHNILVTGSNGQLGNELRLVVEEKDKENNYFFTDVEELDITNKSEVLQFLHANDIDVVVNCAAYTNVDKAEDEKEIADLINHIGVKNLAESCKERDGLLIHISTDYVFDGTKNTPYTETDDQLRAVAEIKEDMQKPLPMDRLLCGDVGYGKTEVAARAVFKCLSEGSRRIDFFLAWKNERVPGKDPIGRV